MPIALRLRPPHRLLMLFLVATLVPSAAMVWLGWQLLAQDRALERQRTQDMLESTATHMASGIAHALDTIDRDLASFVSPSTPLRSDTAVAVALARGGVVAHTGAPLLFVPALAPPVAEPPGTVWAGAEHLEFVADDADAAERAYRVLASSPHLGTRAGALLRLARVLKTDGRHQQALDTYTRLGALSGATIDGNPADLMARWARIRLLDTLARHAAATTEATALGTDLSRGRWAVDRATYTMYASDIARWTGDTTRPAHAALTEAVAWAWADWQAPPLQPRPTHGRRSLRIDGAPVLLVWREDGERLLLFAASRTYLDESWRHLWPEPDLAVAVTDDGGQIVVGRTATGTAIRAVVKPSSDTRLPWTLRVAAAATPDRVTSAGSARRHLLIVGLLLLLFLISSTGYLVGRTVYRELAVVRQQADFVSAVSHEFRSPLTSIAHLTSLLRGEFPITEERRRQYYDVIARDTDRLRRFVETLLDFGRMQAGATRYRLAPLDLSSTVAALVEEFRGDTAAGAHPISLASDDGIPAVAADREALGRAIWNLLENAAKYSAEDSPIAVRVERGDRRVAIRVVDQGSGIPADEQPRVFQPFYRGAAAVASAIKGTGVGLAVVDHVVRGHGGTLMLDSGPGAGSTFSILLPIAEEAHAGDSSRRES